MLYHTTQKELAKADLKLIAAKKKGELAEILDAEEDEITNALSQIDKVLNEQLSKIDSTRNQVELNKALEKAKSQIADKGKEGKKKIEDRINGNEKNDKPKKDNPNNEGKKDEPKGGNTNDDPKGGDRKEDPNRKNDDKRKLNETKNNAYEKIKAEGEKKQGDIDKIKDLDTKKKAKQKLADVVDKAYKEVEAAITPENVANAAEKGINAIRAIDTKDKSGKENSKKDEPNKKPNKDLNKEPNKEPNKNPKKDNSNISPKGDSKKDGNKPSPGGSSGGTTTPKKNDDTTSSKNEGKKNISRISGKSRIETAIEISRKIYRDSSETVILANKNSYPDVLSAVPFAKQLGAPILLTEQKSTPKEVLNEIKRIKARKIIIVGGYGAIGKDQEAELKSSFNTERIGGLNRYETSTLIAEKMMKNGSKSVVEVASGEVFADALAMSTKASTDNAPIILVKQNSLPMSAKNFLGKYNPKVINIAGGESSVSMGIKNELMNLKEKPFVNRFSGKDRYETSTAIARATNFKNDIAVYTSGEIFADALVSGPYAAYKKAPLFLVNKNSLPKVVEKYTKDSKILSAEIVGGASSVTEIVEKAISNSLTK